MQRIRRPHLTFMAAFFDCDEISTSFGSDLGFEISGFCLLSFSQNERTQLSSVCRLFEESVFIFPFLTDKMYNYTANAYRQTTDKLMFKSVISTVR